MKFIDYQKKLKDLKKDYITIDDIFPGLIFRCSWWNMADYYEVVAIKGKSIKLREIDWETCSPEEAGHPGDGDPTWRWTRIKRDENGETVPVKAAFTGEEKVYTKRLKVEKDGTFTFKSPNYDGQANVKVAATDYMHMYWG